MCPSATFKMPMSSCLVELNVLKAHLLISSLWSTASERQDCRNRPERTQALGQRRWFSARFIEFTRIDTDGL